MFLYAYHTNTIPTFLSDRACPSCDRLTSHEHSFCVFERQPMLPKTTVFMFWAATYSCRTYTCSVAYATCMSHEKNSLYLILIQNKNSKHTHTHTHIYVIKTYIYILLISLLKCITIIIIFLYYCNCCCCCCLVISLLLLFLIINLLSLINVCIFTYDRGERLVESSIVPLEPTVEIN